MAKKKIKKVAQRARKVEEPKLYETTFKHKYKVGDRVMVDYISEAKTIKSVGFKIGYPQEPCYLFEDDTWYDEQNIIRLAPQELLSREEKQLLREEIQRCYDRWDECPEIKSISLYKMSTYSVIFLEDEKVASLSIFKVSNKLFSNLEDKRYTLKELGLD